jgi:hypothetical protein
VCGLAIYIKKFKYLKAKERRIMKTQIFISPLQNYNLPKDSSSSKTKPKSFKILLL